MASSFKSLYSTHDMTSSCTSIFIAGDSSSVGKTTTCMYLLASLLHCNYLPHELAYIKPVTQCEAEQSISIFCQQVGIACVPIGPVVFYKGFTRSFLANETCTTHQLLEQIESAVNALKMNKKLIIIDGVGYPSVGSICGISNADVAKRLLTPVLLIGKPGVGDAIDSYNLNAR
jgi:dethiobiotin synthetase